MLDIDIIEKREIEIYEPNPYAIGYGKIKDLPIIDDNQEIIFDSSGKIPSRWMKMIYDFSGLQLKIDDNSLIQKDIFDAGIEDKINRIKDDNLLKNIIKYCLKTQSYNIFITEGKNWKTYEIYDIIYDDYLIPDIVKEVYNDAKSCYSLYPELIREKKDRYSPIDLFGGGINVKYFEEFGLSKLYKITGHYDIGYLEGCSNYASGFNLPVEDVIIFGELLKRNGVNFRDSYRDYEKCKYV
jgi:hypothetical protein